jgi:quercetin dioxygenase-like cupin family protein
MKSIRRGILLATGICAAVLSNAASPQDPSSHKELKRTDLSGAPGMEVISAINEFKPGDELPRHSHPGIETGYVLQGAMVQAPGKEPVMLQAGALIMNLRDVPHGGFKVVGDTSLKAYTVYIVDKGKPLYEWVK